MRWWLPCGHLRTTPGWLSQVSPTGTAALLALALAGVPFPAQCQAEPWATWLKSYMQEQQIPGVAVGIVKGGRIVRAEGFGVANLELGVPIRPETMFESASVGKQFTAMGILLLVQDGRIGLDDPITPFLPDLPAAWRGITVRHLLTHTSGIPEYESDSTLNLRLDYTEEELLRRFVQYPLLFQPGEEWSYSGTGYVLLGMVIRSLTGRHWGELLRTRVFEPLGMTTARVISYDDVVPDRAAGYRTIDGTVHNREVVGPGWNTTADGSLLLSVLDLARWDAGLYGNRLLGDSLKRAMWSPVRLNDGSVTNYGFGWFLTDEPGRRAVEHTGGGWGFKTYLGRFLDDSLTVIVLANSEAADPIVVGHHIAELVDPRLAPRHPTPVRLAPELLDEYRGDYRLPTGEVFVVRPREDGLDFSMGGQLMGHALPEAKDRFFNQDAPDVHAIFLRDSSGAIRWLLPRYFNSSAARAERIRP